MYSTYQATLDAGRAGRVVRVEKVMNLDGSQDSVVATSRGKAFFAIKVEGASVSYEVRERPFSESSEWAYRVISSGTIDDGNVELLSFDDIIGNSVEIIISSDGPSTVLVEGVAY